MFELTTDEFKNWRSQIVTSNSDKMGLRYAPMAFTEQGVAMISSVLNSNRAIQVNIQIMRAFTKISKMVLFDKRFQVIEKQLKLLENKFDDHDEKINLIFKTINKIISYEKKPKKRIGFNNN